MKFVVDHLKAACRKALTDPAVIDNGKQLSYAQLNALSNRVAMGLQSRGIGRGERIGIYMPKSMDALVAIYGTLKVGGCYVPIPPEDPMSRVRLVVNNCSIRVLLVATEQQGQVQQQFSELGVTVFAVSQLATAHGQFTPTCVAAQDAAAILHTSGSTGQPKGAVITQANLAVFLSWARSAFNFVSKDRLLSHAPLHFDLSFFDVFAATAAAAAVVLATPAHTANAVRLARLINQTGVTVWQSVPSALTLQATTKPQQTQPMPTVRAVLFAGERMPRQTLLRLPEIFPNGHFYNIYGCTETNDTFLYKVPADVTQAPDPLPLGKPLPHIRYRVVDESGADVSPGQKGELLVAGETVMAGYLSGNGLLALDGSPGDGFYRTKDVVSLGADGDLRFHGRSDDIIKSNGYRVNLLEIEDHLRRSQRFAEVALLGMPDDLIGNRIMAIIRPRDGKSCSALDLKRYCAVALPKYAIPHSFRITQEELPKNSTGKINKRLLAQLCQ